MCSSPRSASVMGETIVSLIFKGESGFLVMTDALVLLRHTNQDGALVQLGGRGEEDRGGSRERWAEWIGQNRSDPATDAPPPQQHEI